MSKYINNYNLILPLDNVNENFNYNCFDNLNQYLLIDEYYYLLQQCNLKNLQNILNYINIHWCKLNIFLNKKYSNNKYESISINNKCNTYEEFNNNLKSFIDNNIILAIYIINMIINYLSINF